LNRTRIDHKGHEGCGSHLYYRLKQTGQYEMPVGLFDGVDNWVFDHEVFVDERPNYYHFGNQTEEMTGAECFARFAPASWPPH
jgi:hypothetical protein